MKLPNLSSTVTKHELPPHSLTSSKKPIKYQTEAQNYRRNRIIYIFLDIVIIDYNGV